MLGRTDRVYGRHVTMTNSTGKFKFNIQHVAGGIGGFRSYCRQSDPSDSEFVDGYGRFAGDKERYMDLFELSQFDKV